MIQGNSRPSPTGNMGRGILWMIFAALNFTLLDAIAKYLAQTYPVTEIVWARFTFNTILVAVILNRRLPHLLATARVGHQVLRSMLVLVFTGVLFLSLKHLPLADVSAIIFLTPLIVALLSMRLLGERVDSRTIACVFVGFAGALVVIHPTGDAFHAVAAVPLTGAFLYALYQISTRVLSRTDSVLTTFIYSSLVASLGASALVPFVWVEPDVEGWTFMILMGGLGAAAQFSLIKALTLAPAATVSQFGYVSLIWAIVLGFVMFDDIPNATTLIGALIIVGSGFYIFRREHGLAHRVVPVAAP